MTNSERPRIRYKKPWDRAAQDTKKRAELRARRTPYIYFFRCRTFIKIGWTTDVEPRLSNIQMANPDSVTMAALILGGEREEAILHRAFRPLSHRAEWFREEGDLAALLALIDGMDPVIARSVAGEWFLRTFGQTNLLTFDLAAQNPDQGQRIQQENM